MDEIEQRLLSLPKDPESPITISYDRRWGIIQLTRTSEPKIYFVVTDVTKPESNFVIEYRDAINDLTFLKGSDGNPDGLSIGIGNGIIVQILDDGVKASVPPSKVAGLTTTTG